MKKLMIAVAISALAVASQAASFTWNASDATLGVALASLDGNGTYAANGSALKTASGTWYAVLSIYDATSGDLLGKSASTKLGFQYTGAKGIKGSFTVDATIEKSTAYDFLIEITGTQNDIQGVVSADWDYSAATVAASLSGSLTSSAGGATTFSAPSPSSWTVSGAVAVPEPTSGLLLLLGVAGMALRRRRA